MSKAIRSFAAVASLTVPSLASADVVNGSFETESYAGWTLGKDAVSDSFATAAVVQGGTRIEMGTSLLDHAANEMVPNYSSGLPLVAEPTNGQFQALLLQNGPSTTRLSQVVNVPASGELHFDVAYHNWDSAFSAEQVLRVQLRDTDTDAVLATVFQTAGALEMPMSHQAIDVAAFAGMAVRLQFELLAQNDFFDVQLDNIDLRTAAAGEPAPEVVIDSDRPQAEMDSTSADELGGGCSTSRGGGSLFAALALVALRRRRR